MFWKDTIDDVGPSELYSLRVDGVKGTEAVPGGGGCAVGGLGGRVGAMLTTDDRDPGYIADDGLFPCDA